MRPGRILGALALGLSLSAAGLAQQAAARPNIVVIWGDDIGTGTSARTPRDDGQDAQHRQHREERHALHRPLRPAELHRRPRGVHHGPDADPDRRDDGRHPRLDARAPEGGSHPRRGAEESQGYATAQFGKNHLGDRNEFLPTVHGFDEWFGNLYHLNAEEEPEELDYPGQKNPEYAKKFGPRGVLHAWATDVDDPTTDPTFGRVGKQKIQDTGKLTRKRMETVDKEVTDVALAWMDKVGKSGKPFFMWWNSTAIHIWSHPNPKYVQMAVDEGRAEEDVVRARMLEHDELVGSILKKLDDLGIANNTIVVYSTDNGNEFMFWPDGGYAPYRGEKGTTWEGGVRVPCLVKWPGHIAPGTVSNGIQSHEDLFVTLAAAAGLPNLKKDLLTGAKLGGPLTYKVHLDGYNNLDHWTGKSEKSARREFFYYDETDLMAIRVDGWKMHIGVKHNGDWFDEKSYPSVPYVVNLLMDPMEKVTPDAPGYEYAGRKFVGQKLWAPTASGPFLAAHLKSLGEYPPRQAADSLSMKKAVEKAMKMLENPKGSSN
jgi:arylsulfatase